MRQMIRVRKECPAFGRGTIQFLQAGSQAVLAYLRGYGEETILAVHNLSAEGQTVHLDLAPFAGTRPSDLLTGERLPPVAEGAYRLALGRYEFRWLRLR